MKRRQIDELWVAKRSTAPKSLANVLVSEAVLGALRRELKRQTGHNTTEEELSRLLKETVFRPECL